MARPPPCKQATPHLIAPHGAVPCRAVGGDVCHDKRLVHRNGGTMAMSQRYSHLPVSKTGAFAGLGIGTPFSSTVSADFHLSCDGTWRSARAQSQLISRVHEQTRDRRPWCEHRYPNVRRHGTTASSRPAVWPRVLCEKAADAPGTGVAIGDAGWLVPCAGGRVHAHSVCLCQYLAVANLWWAGPLRRRADKGAFIICSDRFAGEGLGFGWVALAIKHGQLARVPGG